MKRLNKTAVITMLTLSILPMSGFMNPDIKTENRQIEIMRNIYEGQSGENLILSDATIQVDPMIFVEPIIREEEKQKEIAVGTKYVDKDTLIRVGPNVMETEIGSVKLDEAVPYYQIMSNGWVRILHMGNIGYISGEDLRDTEKKVVIAEKKVAPKAKTKSAPKKQTTEKPASGKEMTFKLSFYTNNPGENGKYTTTASGKNPTYGMVASNIYPFGTKIYLEGYGEMVVEDRGGKHFNSSDRLDVFIQRKDGESNADYRARAMKLGRQTVKGYIMD